MKKFSTAGHVLRATTLAALLALPISLALHTGDAVAATAKHKCTFRSDAPDQHKVVKGDTLWDISGRFLDHPWCWPEVWGLNREQIRNPHWIYPGQVIIFDRAAGRLRLAGKPDGASGMPEVRMSPHARVEALGPQPIATIPTGAIEPFLTQPLVVDSATADNAPRVLALEEGHLNAGLGDKLYVVGDLKGETSFNVFRPAKPLKDPLTGELLGYEAAYLGSARLERAARASDEANRLVVSSSRQEIAPGARLVPVPARTQMSYAPHLPASPVDGRIVSIYNGVTQAGRNDVVLINRGLQDGVDTGTVLDLVHLGRQLRDPQADAKAAPVRLPDESYGKLFVFRVFDKLSYGLVMQVGDAVKIGDVVRSPE